MNFENLSTPAVILLVITSTLLLVTRNWRWSIAALGLQYLGAFALVAASWPADLAVVKLVAGWMAGSVLGLTCIHAEESVGQERLAGSERVFRLLGAVLVLVVVVSVAPKALEWVPGVSLPQARAGLLLIGVGLLLLGLTAAPFRVVLALTTVLTGFEILYAAVESSTLVAGLLALINLGIALVGAYLMTSTVSEQPA